MRLASSAFLHRAAAMYSSPSSYSVRVPPHSPPLPSISPRHLNPLPLQGRGYPRPRRGYSARPSPPPVAPPDAGAELVSGDSHLTAVRAANESLRRGGGGVRGSTPPYNQGSQPHQPYYGYGYGYQPQDPAPAYGAVPYNYGYPQQQPLPPGPQYGYGAPNPYVHGHPQPQMHWRGPAGAGFRPGAQQLTPRLAEYRRWWRFAKERPPRQAGNIFQNWFQLRYEEDIEFNKLGLRDNVAQLCVLESVVPQNVQTDSTNLSTSSSHPQQAKQVVVCNIHVLYNPKRGDIKLGQVRTLLDRAYTVSKMWNDAPVIICGDFNSTPKSPLYNFVLEQKATSASDALKECTSIDKPNEGCFGGSKTEPGEGPGIMDIPSAPATVCAGILKSGSREVVDSSQLLSSNNLPGDVVSEEFTCTFEANGVQSDHLLAASKEKPNDKENANESKLSAQENCTTNEPESSYFNGSQNVADALHQMSNVSLEGESSTGPAEHVHQPNGACGNEFSAEINNHSVSCADKSENNANAFEDDITTNEVTCSDVNSDPSFFEELSGVNDRLIEEEDQLPATSDSSPSSSQQIVSSGEGYYYYDPYKWTPEEIKAATGNDECTSVEHDLKLRSVYTDVEDFEGTKDANKEPLVTSYHRKFMGTVDYIWASEDLQTVQVLDTFPKEILKQTIGFPTKKWGSDHIALACELAFTK
nr:unnamed protein product [Digitaria exilis]